MRRVRNDLFASVGSLSRIGARDLIVIFSICLIMRLKWGLRVVMSDLRKLSVCWRFSVKRLAMAL